MSFLSKITILLAMILSLSACKEVTFKNGEVPDQYMDQAKELEGTYNGQFNGQKGRLSILFQGNKPYLVFEGERSEDILGNACESEFGLLKSAYFNNSKKLESVTFSFNPNRCVYVMGNTITLQFSSDYKKVAPRILYEQRMERKCEYEFGGPGGGMREVCRYEPKEVYLTGKFRK